jgi:hypothetical protein
MAMSINLLMIVEIVDVNRLTVLEPERNAPIAGDRYGMVSPERAFQGMKPESGEIHILRSPALVEGTENIPKAPNVPWRHASS